MKKKWIVLLAVVLVVLLLVAAVLWWMSARSIGFSTGRCLIAKNGSVLLIDGDTPTVLSGAPDGLQTGDKLFVMHDGINETYPARTKTYFCLKLGNESTGFDIDMLQELEEMGWID